MELHIRLEGRKGLTAQLYQQLVALVVLSRTCHWPTSPPP